MDEADSIEPASEVDELAGYLDRGAELSPESVGRVRAQMQAAMQSDTQVSAISALPKPRRRVFMSAAAAVVAIVASVGVLVTATSPPAAAKWSVIGRLTVATWQESPEGPIPGWLSCTTESQCVVLSTKEGPSSSSTLSVTTNGGSAWNSVSLPSGLVATTGLECSDGACFAGGIKTTPMTSIPVLLETNAAQGMWTSRPLPSEVGTIYALTCLTPTRCVGLASHSPTRGDATFLRTDDGGSTWSEYAFPGAQVLSALSCGSELDCVVGGDLPSASPGVPGTATIWLTADGGSTWSQGSLPAGTSAVEQVSCPSSSACTSIAGIPSNGSGCAQANGLSAGVPAKICAALGSGLGTEILTSGDGGRSWSHGSVPSSSAASTLFAITCPTVSDCWATGSNPFATSPSAPLPTRSGAGIPLILRSNDAGEVGAKRPCPRSKAL